MALTDTSSSVALRQALSSKTIMSPSCHQEILDAIAHEKTQRSKTEREATASLRERAQPSPFLPNKMTPDRATTKSSLSTGTSWNFRDVTLMVLVIVLVGGLYKYISASKHTRVRGKKKRSRFKKH